MHEEEKMAIRSLKSCIPAAAVITYALCALHHKSWALCYATGALLSLFSLFTLTVVVPMLFRPGAHPSVKALLGLTLMMKLPIYMVALYAMTRLAAAGAAASVAGITLAPMVITVKTVIAAVFHPRAKENRPERVAWRKAGATTANRTAQNAAPAEGG